MKNNNLLNPHELYDTMITLSFSFFFIVDILRVGYATLLQLLGFSNALAPLLVILTIYTPLFVLLPNIRIESSFLPFARIILVAAILFSLSLIIHPEYDNWFNHPTYGVSSYIFRPDRAPYLYLFVLLNRTNKELFKNLKIGALLILAGCLLRIFMISGLLPSLWHMSMDYSMTLGYDLLVSAVILFAHFLRNKALHLLFLSTISVIFMIRYGSRMPIAIFAAFLVAILIKDTIFKRKSTRIPTFFIFFLIMGSLLFILNDYILPIFSNITIDSRTISMLIGGKITAGTGRDRIYLKTLDVIRSNPIWGVGLYGDRFHLTDTIRYGYPHNMVLEVLASFGIVPGAMLLIGLIYHVLKNLLQNRDEDWLDSMIIFCAISLQLLVSYSYWYIPAFWGMLAMLHPKRVFENTSVMRQSPFDN